MAAIAKTLTADDISILARYFSQLPVAAVTATAALPEHLAIAVQALETTTAPTVHLLEAAAAALHR